MLEKSALRTWPSSNLDNPTHTFRGHRGVASINVRWWGRALCLEASMRRLGEPGAGGITGPLGTIQRGRASLRTGGFELGSTCPVYTPPPNPGGDSRDPKIGGQ